MCSVVRVIAKVFRDENGHIERGDLREFHALEAGDPLEAWGEWLNTNAPAWNGIEDVEAELHRDD
jgi:hypothetical protein